MRQLLGSQVRTYYTGVNLKGIFMSKYNDFYEENFDLNLKILSCEGDRGAVLTVSAFIENKLTDLIKENIPPAAHDVFFSKTGIAKNFYVKIKLCEAYGIVDSDAIHYIDSFRANIRNEFSHNFNTISISCLEHKFLGLLRGYGKLNSLVKQKVGGKSPNELSTRLLFNISSAYLMTDLAMFNLEPKFLINEKLKQRELILDIING